MRLFIRHAGLVLCGLVMVALLSGCTALGIKTIPMETLKQKYFNEHSRVLECQGVKIHYRDEGSGPVLLLIHGVCASLHTWDGWVEELNKNYRIIRVDLPGFGLTPLTDIKFISRETSVALLDEAARQLGIERFSIAGNSLGGYVAWTYAVAHPEKVEKLILVDPGGYPMDLPWILSFASNPVVRPFSRHMMPKFVFDMAVGQVYGDKKRIVDSTRDRYFELAMREGGKREYIEIFKALKKEMKKSTFSEGIDRIPAPLLLMWGDKDIWIKYPEQYEQWKNDHPGASFIVYTGAGHVPMEEIPAVTAEDARLFLSGQMGPGEIIR